MHLLPQDLRELTRRHYGPPVTATRAATAVCIARVDAPGPDIASAGICVSSPRLPRRRARRHDAGDPHGFRSSFRDWAAEQTSRPRDVIEAALAHRVRNRTEAAYARSDVFRTPPKALMIEWAVYLYGADRAPHGPP